MFSLSNWKINLINFSFYSFLANSRIERLLLKQKEGQHSSAIFGQLSATSTTDRIHCAISLLIFCCNKSFNFVQGNPEKIRLLHILNGKAANLGLFGIIQFPRKERGIEEGMPVFFFIYENMKNYNNNTTLHPKSPLKICGI